MSHPLQLLARAGYAAKGVVYGVIGLMAAQAAIGGGGRPEGSEGAVEEIGGQPFGVVWLAVVAVGLTAYVAWRLTQAVLDPDRRGKDWKGVFARIGLGLSGLGYVGLALAAARGAIGGDADPGGDAKVEWTGRLLAMPGGSWIVGIIGLVVIGVGIAQFAIAWSGSFLKYYDRAAMSATALAWARRIGQIGFSARGVTFGIIGGFVVAAAAHGDASEASGLEGALHALAAQPYGALLLGAVALGLVAYGVHCLSCARWRVVRPT